MQFRFKDIHIGKLIEQLVKEKEIDNERIVAFFNIEEQQIVKMYQSKSLETEILLRWSKLLKYDFFRVYSQHLVLYAPPSSLGYQKDRPQKSKIPRFRKNVYTTGIISFIVEMVNKKEKTPKQIMEEYNIPKTTLYKWIKKYKKDV